VLYNTLVYQREGSVVTITINRPTVNNAINAQLAQELIDICHNIKIDDSAMVVIVTGAGEEAFSIGIDLDEFSPASKEQQELTLPLVAATVASLDCPTIAAINGDALGQGLELALACDVRIAVETARFALAITSGLIPWDGGTQRLPRLVGRGKAMEMILTGGAIDASEAYRVGLVNKVVPSKELIPTVRDMAQAMVSKAPLSLKYAKEAIHKGLGLTLEQGLRLEADLYLLLQTTEDRTEGITAFREKRRVKFKGK
jgi:enoyl-CoA hydratase